MKDVATYTRLPPAKKQKVVQNLINSILDNKDAMRHLSGWGLQLSTKNLRLDGRTLPSPVLLFGGGYKETVGPKGDWGRASTNKPALLAKPLDKWTVLVSSRDQKTAKAFINIVRQQAPRMGITVKEPKVVALDQDRTGNYLDAIRDLADDTQMVQIQSF
jgi:hypothetical protein